MNKNNLSQWIINPFNKIAGLKAFVTGLLIFVATIVIAQLQHIVFIGVISVKLMNVSLLNALLFALIGLFVFSALLYIVGRLISKSSIRIIDVIGTLSLAKTPLLFIALICSIPVVMSGTIEITSSLLPSANIVVPYTQNYIYFGIFIIVTLLCIIWMLILSYNAFSISCNVKGSKAISGFIAVIILTEIISYIIISQVTDFRQISSIDNLPTPKTEIQTSTDYSQINTIAIQATKHLIDSNYEQVYNLFDSTMQTALPTSKLEQTMNQLEHQLGKLKEMGTDIKNTESNDYKLVYIPCIFEKQKVHIQYTFNKENQISGFYIRP